MIKPALSKKYSTRHIHGKEKKKNPQEDLEK